MFRIFFFVFLCMLLVVRTEAGGGSIIGGNASNITNLNHGSQTAEGDAIVNNYNSGSTHNEHKNGGKILYVVPILVLKIINLCFF